MRVDKPKLSVAAAQLLYDGMKAQDRLIDAEIERVRGATATIAGAYENAHKAWEVRQGIARELGMLAPDDFAPGSQDGQPMAPYVGDIRFMRPHPFPPPNSIDGRRKHIGEFDDSDARR